MRPYARSGVKRIDDDKIFGTGIVFARQLVKFGNKEDQTNYCIPFVFHSFK